MKQDTNNPKHYIADAGYVFKRVNNGFREIDGAIFGTSIILGEILVGDNGETLETPIEDKIEYYAEVPKPEKHNKAVSE